MVLLARGDVLCGWGGMVAPPDPVPYHTLPPKNLESWALAPWHLVLVLRKGDTQNHCSVVARFCCVCVAIEEAWCDDGVCGSEVV